LPPPPGSVPTISEITVLGIQPTNLTAGMINSVCVNITHNWDDDLDIFLVSPAGQAVELSTDNGQDGNDYVNTCFTEDALNKINAPGPFAPASAAPFTGKFLPEGPWTDLYDATYPANGTWGIYVKDDQNGFSGQLDNWSIIFNPVYKVKYEWLPTTDIDCPTCAIVNVSPDTNTTYIVKATDTYGCEVFDTVLVKIEGNVEAPTVQCESSTQTTLNFAWPAVAGATSYEVNINGQGWISPNPGPLNHFLSGLNLNESVTIEVRAIGSCISSSTSATCTTDDCDNPVPQIISLQDLVCPNDMMGGITLIGSGGNVPYQFKIGTEVNTTGAFTGLDGGTYTAQIIDATGCIGLINFTLLEPDPFVTKPVIVTPLDCSPNPLGAVTIDIKGGTQPYQFDWSNLQTDSIIVGLNPGTYYVTVTDAKLCQVVDSVRLVQNIPSLLINVVPVKCFGDSTGSIEVTVAGGTLPLSYAWSGPVFVPGVEDQLGLPAGIYMVTVTDAVGCTKSATIPITQPATAVSGTFAPVDTICGGASNGMTEVFPLGGTFPYSVSWSNNVFNTKLSNLPAGKYIATIIDGKGCRWVDSTTVFERDLMKIGISAIGPLCFNGTDGQAEVTSVQYTNNVLDVNVLGYLWNTVPPQLTRFATNLKGGQIYSVTVTDLIGCEGDTSILIPNPPAIMISTDSIRNLDCANDGSGFAAVAVNGGNGPFQYIWDNAAQSQNTPEALDLDAGIYEVTVTDANNCTMVHQVEVTQPDPIDIQIIEQPLFCLDQIVGSAAAAINGGSPPYDISWSNGSNGPIIGQLIAGDYIVTVEDGKGCISVDTAHILYLGAPIAFDVDAKDINCYGAASGQLITSVTAGLGPLQFSTNGINYQSSPIFGGLGAGDYRVFVRDVNGCIDTSQQYTLTEPDPLELEIGPGFTLTIGSDTTLNSIVLGGVPGYQYIWTSSDSSLLSCYDCPNPTITPFEQTGVQLTVIDQNGCKVSDALTIGVRLLRFIFVPSGFSPDGDGVNDVLNIFSPPGIKITEFKIFDRWGEMLFYAPTVPFNDTSFGWDGKLKGKTLNPAVFVWTTEVEYLDGRKESISGTTTLLR
ncbi:MAG: proprotein convertase P-domain-containing protein, partial [Saprospiraceae bacterium]